MLISCKFRIYSRIYSSKTIQVKLNEQLELYRWLYNRLLSEVNKARKERRKIKGKTLKPSSSNSSGKRNPELDKVYSRVLQMVIHQLWSQT